MGSSSAVGSVLAGLESTRAWQEQLYQDVHRHPESSHQEHRTAELIADRLRRAGYEVHEGVGGTGVVGLLRNGEGPVVLLRADMDALPVREATGLPYASEVTATDADGNEVPVMHACGHDVHVACLAGAAQLLADGRTHWDGTLVLVFQPAEETGNGARGMVEGGLEELIPAPQVALAQHVMPMPAGRVGTRSGPALSAADSMRITLYGRGAHGSMPRAAVDPVVLAAMIVVRLQTVVAREVAPTETAVLTVGPVRLDASRQLAHRGERELRLTLKEFGVLRYLMTRPGHLVSSEELLEHVWDENADPFTQTVRVTVGTLRRKLSVEGEPQLLETLIGRGYRLRVDEPAEARA